MAIRQAQLETASHAKRELRATISHELRTPLNGILGMNELLLTTDLSVRQREHVLLCDPSGKSLLQLITDTFDLSKIEAGKLELSSRNCSLEEFTYDVVDVMSHAARAKQLVLHSRIAPEARVTGWFDDSLLRQVLVNLIGNAVKFTSSGSITIPVDRIAYKDQMVRLRFVVSDSGIGIPKERLNRLFNSFSQVDSSTTRQFGGTGLGLSISKPVDCEHLRATLAEYLDPQSPLVQAAGQDQTPAELPVKRKPVLQVSRWALAPAIARLNRG